MRAARPAMAGPGFLRGSASCPLFRAAVKNSVQPGVSSLAYPLLFHFWTDAGILAAGVAAAIPAGAALGGAWTLPAGRGLAILSGSSTVASEGFGAEGRDDLVTDLAKDELELLIEYGLRDEVTLLFRPKMTSLLLGAPVHASRIGPGYTELGLRGRLWKSERSVVSAQLLGRIPGTRDATDPAAVGSTDPEFDLRLLAGRSFDLFARPGFLDAQLGDPPDELRFDATLGLRVSESLLLLIQSFSVVGSGADGVFEDASYHKVKISGVWDLSESWSLQAGAIATVAGEHALRERGLTLALWKRF